MDNITECPVCLEEYQNPRILPCSHTLCSKCLESLQKKKFIVCPLCKAKHEIPRRGVGSFPENQHVTQLIVERQKTRLLETKLQTAEQAGSDATDKRGETAAATAADEMKTIGDNGGESTKKDAACAILPEEEGIKHHNDAKVNDDSQTSETNADENLITFSRQKLALIQCEYDPKRCGFCEKMFAELKHCKKCKTANYCSKECQSKDWEKRHKKDCKEMRRLQDNIDKKLSSTSKVQVFTVKLSVHPHNLERNMEYSTLYFHQGKLLMSGFQPYTESGRLLDVYNPETFEKERTVTMVGEQFNIADLCALTIENARFVAVSIQSMPIDSNPSRVELWAFPIPSTKPVYTFTEKDAKYGPMCFSESKLLIRNEGRGTLDELDASSIPFRQTGVSIPTGFALPSSLQSMCLIRKNYEKQIVLQYLKDEGWEDSRIKCINYEGQEMWNLGDLNAARLDGIPFQPYGICVDEEGNIYSAEQDSNRVIVIKRDLSVQVLLNAPGSVSCIGWCDQTQKLYVTYDVSGKYSGADFQVAIAGYKITKGK